MTKAKKPSGKMDAPKKGDAPEPKKSHPKKNYLVDDEDEEDEDVLKKDTEEDDEDVEVDPDDADIVVPKTFDPFEDDDDDDDF